MELTSKLTKGQPERLFIIIFVMLALSILAIQFFLLDRVNYGLWGDRDMYRAANLLHSFQTTSAEFSYGDGARIPGGFMYYLWYLVLLLDKTPVTLFHLQSLLSIMAGCLLAVIANKYYGFVGAISAFVLYNASSIVDRNMAIVWNPGYSAFFVAGFFFFFYTAINDGKMKFLKWAAACIAIAAQMHLSAALLLIPFVSVLFLRVSLLREYKSWLASFVMIALLYSPHIISEFTNGFHNTKLIGSQEQLRDKLSLAAIVKKLQLELTPSAGFRYGWNYSPSKALDEFSWNTVRINVKENPTAYVYKDIEISPRKIGSYFNLVSSARTNDKKAGFSSVYFLDKSKKVIDGVSSTRFEKDKFITQVASAVIPKGTRYIRIQPAYLSHAKKNAFFEVRHVKWAFSSVSLNLVVTTSLRNILAKKNVENIKILPVRFLLDSGAIVSKSTSKQSLSKLIANGIYVIAALGLLLFIGLLLYSLRSGASRNNETLKLDLAMKATFVYLLGSILYYYSDMQVHLELGHSARYLQTLLPAVALICAFSISFFYSLLANRNKYIKSIFLATFTGTLLFPIYGKMERYRPFDEKIRGDYYNNQELFQRISTITGWTKQQLFRKSIRANYANGEWRWRNATESAYELFLQQKKYLGSDNSPCAVIFKQPPSILFPVNTAYLQKLFGQDTGSLSIIKQKNIELSSGERYLFVEYSREHGRCLSSFSNRYVFLPEEQILFDHFRGIKIGQPQELPARKGYPEKNYIVGTYNERYVGSKEIIAMYFRFINIGNHLKLELYSNQLRGLAFNFGYYASGMLGHPKLEFTDNVTGEKVVYPIAYDLVGHKGVLAPLYMDIPLAKGLDYRVELISEFIPGINQVLWPMPNMKRVKKRVLITKHFGWPIK